MVVSEVTVVTPGSVDRLYAARSLLPFSLYVETKTSGATPRLASVTRKTPRKPAELQTALATSLARAEHEPPVYVQQIRALSRATSLLSIYVAEAREAIARLNQELETCRTSSHSLDVTSGPPLSGHLDREIDEHAVRELKGTCEQVWLARKRKDRLEEETAIAQQTLQALQAGECPHISSYAQPTNIAVLSSTPMVPIRSRRRRRPSRATTSTLLIPRFHPPLPNKPTLRTPTTRNNTPRIPSNATVRKASHDRPSTPLSRSLPMTTLTASPRSIHSSSTIMPSHLPSRPNSLFLGRLLAPIPQTVINPLSPFGALERAHGTATVFTRTPLMERDDILRSRTAQEALDGVTVPSYALDLLSDLDAALDLELSSPIPAHVPSQAPITSPLSTPKITNTWSPSKSKTKAKVKIAPDPARPPLTDKRTDSATLPRASGASAASPAPALRKRLSSIFRDPKSPSSTPTSPPLSTQSGHNWGKPLRPPSPVKAALSIFEKRISGQSQTQTESLEGHDEEKKGGLADRLGLKRFSKMGRS